MGQSGDAADLGERVILGEWLFEPSLNRLTKNGTNVRLEPKLADLLGLLTRNSGRVVAKDEIIDAVWEGKFVADSALTRAMAELRRALGDDAHHPRYIETISKRGYRLLAQPRAVADESSLSRSGRRTRVFLGTVGLALLLVVVPWLWKKHISANEPAQPTVNAIVILPLEDLSVDSEGEYFAASMTEALATDLARVGGFRVISRRSVEQHLAEKGSLSGIATRLGADAAVEGSIVRADGRVRIDVRLTEAETETHLWASSYERDFVDILTLQREVARAIAGELSSSLADAGQPSDAVAPKVNPMAHDLYLKGRHALSHSYDQGPNDAADFFQRAIDIAPTYAPAYAGLADYYSTLTIGDFLKPHDGFPKARNAALRALELDTDLGEAYAALAHVEFFFDWDWEDAETNFRRALELNPADARAHHAFSFFLTCMGRFDEAEAVARVELELDPLNEPHHLAWVLFNARRYDESMALLEAPNTTEASAETKKPWLIGWNLALLGRYEESIPILRRVAEARDDDHPVSLGILGWALASAGKDEEALTVLERLRDLTRDSGADVYAQAVVMSALGDTEPALDLLEQAVLQRSPNAIFLGVEPFLDPLRDHPRYQRLLASTGLSDVGS